MDFQREFPMSIEEFHRMPWRLGWKHEYFDDRAYLSPSYTSMDVYLPASKWGSKPPVLLTRPKPSDAVALGSLFYRAFRPSVEFVGYSDDRVRLEANMSIHGFFEGTFGEPMASSRIVVREASIVGAMLLVEEPRAPFVRLLMVDPDCHRTGIGTALLAAVTEDLLLHGFDVVRSRYFVANEPSRRWHTEMGFIEDPDMMATSHYRNFYRHELSRLREDPAADPEEVQRVEWEFSRWDRLAAEKGVFRW